MIQHPLHDLSVRLQADLKKNDHYTENPMFCLQILQRDTGYDIAYAYNKCWWNPGQQELVCDDDPDFKEDLDDVPGWEGPFGYKDRWETVMVALSQEGIDNYMLQDGHNVKRRAFRGKTRTYVDSFNRCLEMVDVRNYLLMQGMPAASAGAALIATENKALREDKDRLLGWRENDWPKWFCRRTAEALCEYVKEGVRGE